MYFLVGLLVLIVVLMLRRDLWFDADKGIFTAPLTKLLLRYGGALFVLATLITLGDQSVVIVPAGFRGVIFNKISGVRLMPMGEGFNFIIPFIEQATLTDVRVQKDTFEASAASKDLQMIHTKVALNFHPIQESTPLLFKDFGLNYADKVIHPAVQEAVKAVAAKFTAEELITRREEVKNTIRELVAHQVTFANIKVDELYITDFEFSRLFSESIESKQIAEQNALKAKRDLDRIKIEAEQKVATSRAEAEALKMQREAVSPQLIQLRQVEVQKLAVDKWNGVMPTVMMGNNGATPLLDLGSLRPK